MEEAPEVMPAGVEEIVLSFNVRTSTGGLNDGLCPSWPDAGRSRAQTERRRGLQVRIK